MASETNGGKDAHGSGPAPSLSGMGTFRAVCAAIPAAGTVLLLGAGLGTWAAIRGMRTPPSTFLLIISIIAGLLAWYIVAGVAAACIRILGEARTMGPRGPVEATREKCPELFAMIDGLCGRLGRPAPGRVALFDAPAAGTVWDADLRRVMRCPASAGEAGLAVGIGILHGSSTAEAQAQLAHALAHTCPSNPYARAYTERFTAAAFTYGQSLGSRPRLLIVYLADRLVVSRLLKWAFSKVDTAYGSISDKVEYATDAVAASVAGRSALVSALCKASTLWKATEAFMDNLGNLEDEGSTVEDFYGCLDIHTKAMDDPAVPVLSYDVPLEALPDRPSRVWYRENDDIHPPVRDRIEALGGYGSPTTDTTPARDAWPLAPGDLVAAATAPAHPAQRYGRKLEPKSNKQYKDWLLGFPMESDIPLELRPYLGREPTPFDREGAPGCHRNPVTPENTRVLQELEAARRDLSTLEDIASGAIETTDVRYDGRPCPLDGLPIQEHKAYLEGLVRQAMPIDAAVYRYLLDNLPSKRRDLCAAAYDDLFWAAEARKALGQIQAGSDALGSARSPNAEEVARLEELLRDFLQGTDFERFRIHMDVEAALRLRRYADKVHNTPGRFDRAQFELLLETVADTSSAVSGIGLSARIVLASLLSGLR